MLIAAFNSQWTSFGMHLIIVILLAIIYKKCSQRSPLPSLKTGHVFVYYSLMRSAYKNRKYSIHPLCIIFQFLCGICRVFDRHRITDMWILCKQFVLLYKPETIEAILSSTVEIEKSSEYQFLHQWLGTGLLTSSGEKWKSRRKLLTPAFYFRILEDFVPVYDKQSTVLSEKLVELSCHKSSFDIVPLMKMCALDIICQTAMGVNINAQNGGAKDYVKALHEVGDTFLYRVLRPWLWSDRIFYWSPVGRKFQSNVKTLHGFAKKIIKEKKEFFLKNISSTLKVEDHMSVKRSKAFLELLLEHHFLDESFTEDDILKEVNTFMVAGHDTVALSSSWALYLLGLNPDIQALVHDELDDVLGSDTSRPITREDLTHMKYLECVIKETLRLYPSVPLISRQLKSAVQVLDYKIPAGSNCIVLFWMLHRDSELFPNPERFQPERFFLDNSAHRHPYSYIPFSAGPRNCIGQKFAIMEEKTILANIMRRFRVLSLDHQDKVNVIPHLVMKNVEPLRMRFILRDKNFKTEK